MPILIDGFNLIYKFPEFEGLMYRGLLSDARRGLLDRLKLYVKITGYKVMVVLDGRKEKSLELKSERVGLIDVFYSLDFSADYLIKQFIKKDINPRMTTVVTSDKDIIDYVSRFRARVSKSEDFAEQVNMVIEKWQDEQSVEKEDDLVLDNDEIAFWEDQFSK